MNQTSALGDLLVRLSGHDPGVVNKRLSRSGSTERLRLIQLGLSLFVPSIVGGLSFAYVLSKVFDSAAVVAACAIGYGLVILAVDRYFVLSIRRTASQKALLPVLLRVLLAISIGVVVSEPLIVKFFEKSIDKQLSADLADELGQKSDPLSLKRADLATEVSSQEDALRLLRERRAAALANTAAIDDQIRTVSLQGATQNSTNAEKVRSAIPLVEQSIHELEERLQKADTDLESLAASIKAEKAGTRGSGEKGIGPEYRRLVAERARLVRARDADAKTLDGEKAKLTQLRSELALLVSNAKNPNQSTLDALATQKLERVMNPDRAVDDQAVKYIEEQIAAKSRELAETRARLRRVDEQLDMLRGNVRLTDRDDLLARTKGLWKVLNREGGVLAWTFFLGFVAIFMVIDTLPLITKLTFRSISDDVTNQLESSDREALIDALAMEKMAKAFELDEQMAFERVNAAVKIGDEIVRLSRELDRLVSEVGNTGDPAKDDFRAAIRDIVNKALRKLFADGDASERPQPDVFWGRGRAPGAI